MYDREDELIDYTTKVTTLVYILLGYVDAIRGTCFSNMSIESLLESKEAFIALRDSTIKETDRIRQVLAERM